MTGGAGMDNKKREWDVWFGGLGFIIILVTFVKGIIDNNSSLTTYGFCIGVIFVIVGVIINKLEESSGNDTIDVNLIKKTKKDVSDWFDCKNKKYKINIDNVLSIRKEGYSRYFFLMYYYWTKDNSLFLFPQKEDFIYQYINIKNSIEYCEENAILESINISNIVYFKTVGDISYVTNVESTGVNVKGAVIGAAVAGDTGAVIGSRPKITSKVEEKDNRYVELKYKDNGTIKTLEFDYTALSIFRNLFPEKEFEYVNFKSENLEEKNVTNDTTTTLSLEEKFEKLKSLKNSGLITEEEFSDKKKELLKQI